MGRTLNQNNSNKGGNNSVIGTNLIAYFTKKDKSVVIATKL